MQAIEKKNILIILFAHTKYTLAKSIAETKRNGDIDNITKVNFHPLEKPIE
jgi:hypothetical protein